MNLSVSDEIALLRAQVEYLLDRFADHPALGERAVNWTALDSSHAAKRWGQLLDWVDWLREHYQLRETLPACWYDHPPMLEELSALRSSWFGAYLDPQAHAADGSAWHDLLDRTLQRLREWDRTSCADGTHRPEVPTPDDTDHSHRERTVHADLAARETEGEPQP